MNYIYAIVVVICLVGAFMWYLFSTPKVELRDEMEVYEEQLKKAPEGILMEELNPTL